MNRKLRVIALTVVTLLSLQITKAQTNYNFESWSGSPESPDNWTTLNLLTTYALITDTSVVKVTGQSGYAAEMHPVSLKALGYANYLSKPCKLKRAIL